MAASSIPGRAQHAHDEVDDPVERWAPLGGGRDERPGQHRAQQHVEHVVPVDRRIDTALGRGIEDGVELRPERDPAPLLRRRDDVALVGAMLTSARCSFGNGGSVPGLSIIISYLLVMVSVVVLVLYIHHIGQSLRVSALIELVGSDTRALLDTEYPESVARAADKTDDIITARSGVVTMIDRDELIALATDADCALEMVPPLGAFVPAGAPLFRVVGDCRRIDEERVMGSIRLGLERTLDQDVATACGCRDRPPACRTAPRRR